MHTGMEYRGKLACVDGFMNVVLQNTEVYSQGKLKRKYNDAFIRGNNGMYNIVRHLLHPFTTTVAYISVKKAQ